MLSVLQLDPSPPQWAQPMVEQTCACGFLRPLWTTARGIEPVLRAPPAALAALRLAPRLGRTHLTEDVVNALHVFFYGHKKPVHKNFVRWVCHVALHLVCAGKYYRLCCESNVCATPLLLALEEAMSSSRVTS